MVQVGPRQWERVLDMVGKIRGLGMEVLPLLACFAAPPTSGAAVQPCSSSWLAFPVRSTDLVVLDRRGHRSVSKIILLGIEPVRHSVCWPMGGATSMPTLQSHQHS